MEPCNWLTKRVCIQDARCQDARLSKDVVSEQMGWKTECQVALVLEDYLNFLKVIHKDEDGCITLKCICSTATVLLLKKYLQTASENCIP